MRCRCIRQTDDITSAMEELEGLTDEKAEQDHKLAAARGGLQTAQDAALAVPKPAQVRLTIKVQLIKRSCTLH